MTKKVNGYTVEFGNKHGDGSMAYIYENGELAYSKHGVMNESDFENVCKLVEGLERGSEV